MAFDLAKQLEIAGRSEYRARLPAGCAAPEELERFGGVLLTPDYPAHGSFDALRRQLGLWQCRIAGRDPARPDADRDRPHLQRPRQQRDGISRQSRDVAPEPKQGPVRPFGLSDPARARRHCVAGGDRSHQGQEQDAGARNVPRAFAPLRPLFLADALPRRSRELPLRVRASFGRNGGLGAPARRRRLASRRGDRGALRPRRQAEHGNARRACLRRAVPRALPAGVRSARRRGPCRGRDVDRAASVRGPP